MNLSTASSTTGFDNNGHEFNATGMAGVTFAGETDLLRGSLGRTEDGLTASALSSITVAAGAVVTLGDEDAEGIFNTQNPTATSFEIFAADDFTFNVAGEFTTVGAAQFGVAGDNSYIAINGVGTTNLLGHTVLQGDAQFVVADGATLGFDLAKTNLNVTAGAMDSLTFNLSAGVDSWLDVYGEVDPEDEALLTAWQTGSPERKYAYVELFGPQLEDDPDQAGQVFSASSVTTIWKVVAERDAAGVATGEFIIVPTLSETARISDGFLVALGMHNRYAAWHAVRDRMISSSGFNYNGYRGQSPCDAICGPCDAACDPCDAACGTVRRNSTRNAWVNYTGRSDTLSSNGFLTNNWRISAEGLQAGADLFLSRNSQFGVLFGYEGGYARNTVNDFLKMDDVYVGFYGARVLRNGYDVRGVVALGWQDFDYTREQGVDLAKASFKGHSAEVNLELGRRFASYRSGWSVRPVIALDVFNNNVKATTDSLDYRYEKSHLTQAFLRFGSDLRYQMSNFTFNSGFYYSYDMNDDVLRTNVSYQGGAPLALSGAKLGRNLLTFNLGTDYQVTRNFSLFGGYQGEYATDRDNSQVHSAGYVGAGFKW